MKRIDLVLLLVCLCCIQGITFAQGVSINKTGLPSDSSAMLDISSESAGLLIPRMTEVQRDAIASPANTLFVFNTTSVCLEMYNSITSSWEAIHCACQSPFPASPTALAATSVTYSSFTANWTASSGADAYFLDVSTDNGFSSFVSGYNNLNVGNVTTYNLSGLNCATTYYYRLRAVDHCGTSPNSNVISLTTSGPAAPAAQSASGITSSTFTANWVAVSGAVNYYLDVATDNGFTNFVSGFNNLNVGNVSSYSVTGLTCASNYYYRVRVEDSCTTSVSSNVISITSGSCCSVSTGTVFEFTTCGNSGRLGPSQSQCNGSYSGTPLAGDVTVVDGLQQWTAPCPGTYRITAIGAAGLTSSGTAVSPTGGVVRADFALTNETLHILVGQLGGDGYSGGGGSFVVFGDSTVPMIVAGGGGATNVGAPTFHRANMGTCGNAGNGGPGGCNGDGAGTGTISSYGPGGGFYTNGVNGSGYGGWAYVNGGYGGNRSSWLGAYGGGGSAVGGGGGYSGGGISAGDGTTAGGAGSFIHVSAQNPQTSDGTWTTTGSEPDNVYTGSVGNLNQWNTGVGSVTIEYLGP